AARFQGPRRGAARLLGQAITDRRGQPHHEVGRNQRERRQLELGGARFVGGEPAAVNLRRDAVEGLSRPQKALAQKYFYDAAGSALFECICRLREYYPTRTELAITKR